MSTRTSAGERAARPRAAATERTWRVVVRGPLHGAASERREIEMSSIAPADADGGSVAIRAFAHWVRSSNVTSNTIWTVEAESERPRPMAATDAPAAGRPDRPPTERHRVRLRVPTASNRRSRRRGAWLHARSEARNTGREPVDTATTIPPGDGQSEALAWTGPVSGKRH